MACKGLAFVDLWVDEDRVEGVCDVLVIFPVMWLGLVDFIGQLILLIV